MWRYILQRVLIFIPTLFGITVISFVVIAMAPGDAATAMLAEGGEIAKAAQLADLRAKYGLDDPLPIRYARWMGQLLRGNLGTSLIDSRPVSDTLVHTVGLTLEFTVPAFIIGLALAVVLGAWSGFRPLSRFDRVVSFGSMFVIATPSFVLALLALYVLAVRLPILPSGGNRDMLGADAANLVNRLPYFVLPVSTLAFLTAAEIIRYVRDSVIDVCGEDYVRTARAKGLNERLVLVRHALRNSLLPVLTLSGLLLAFLLGGSVAVEQAFGTPGLGTFMVRAAVERDIKIVQNLTLFYAAIFIIVNLGVDVLYGWLDPRIRLA